MRLSSTLLMLCLGCTTAIATEPTTVSTDAQPRRIDASDRAAITGLFSRLTATEELVVRVTTSQCFGGWDHELIFRGTGPWSVAVTDFPLATPESMSSAPVQLGTLQLSNTDIMRIEAAFERYRKPSLGRSTTNTSITLERRHGNLATFNERWSQPESAPKILKELVERVTPVGYHDTVN